MLMVSITGVKLQLVLIHMEPLEAMSAMTAHTVVGCRKICVCVVMCQIETSHTWKKSHFANSWK